VVRGCHLRVSLFLLFIIDLNLKFGLFIDVFSGKLYFRLPGEFNPYLLLLADEAHPMLRRDLNERLLISEPLTWFNG